MGNTCNSGHLVSTHIVKIVEDWCVETNRCFPHGYHLVFPLSHLTNSSSIQNGKTQMSCLLKKASPCRAVTLTGHRTMSCTLHASQELTP